MTKYTIADVANIVPENLTPNQIKGVEDYLNEGIIPEPDPCQNCDPNFIRKLISLIRTAERTGMFSPKREDPTEYSPMSEYNEFTDDVAPEVDWAEGSYAAGTLSKQELDYIQGQPVDSIDDTEEN